MGKLLHIHHQDMFELNMFHTVDDSGSSGSSAPKIFYRTLVNHGISTTQPQLVIAIFLNHQQVEFPNPKNGKLNGAPPLPNIPTIMGERS